MAIEERIKKAIAKALGNKKVFERLEKGSGIKGSSWQAMLYGRQRATSEMIEYICRKLPEYAYWMVTGFIPSNETKHESPEEKNKNDNSLSMNELLKKEGVDLKHNEYEWLSGQLFAHIEEKIRLKTEEIIAIDIVLTSANQSKRVEDVIIEMRADVGSKFFEDAVIFLDKIRNAKKN